MTLIALPPTGRRLCLHELPSELTAAAVAAYRPGMQVITPNFEAGRCLRNHLGSSVTVTTLTQWARLLLGREGWQILKPYEMLSHLHSAIDGLEWEYLGPLIDRQATLQHLLKLIGELQRARITPAALWQVAATAREADLARAHEAYQAHGLATGRYDANGAEYMAGNLPELPARAVLIHGYAYLDQAQLHLLDRLLGAGSVVTLPLLPSSARRNVQTRQALLDYGFEVMP